MKLRDLILLLTAEATARGLDKEVLVGSRYESQYYNKNITGIGELYRDDNFLVLEVEGGLGE